jgi:hypothetical protein
MNILFVGLGNLGSQVFDLFLLRGAAQHRFLVAGRNQEYLLQRTSLAAYAVMQLGLTPDLNCTSMDVQQVEQTAQTIWSFKPDLIFTSVTIQPSSAISKLPKPLFEELAQAGPGPWLPLTLVLVYKLMQAVKQTGLNIKVLNGASPDNAGSVLRKVNLAPTTGIGNLANIIPAIRKAIALQLNKPVEQVHILFVGHNQVAHSLRTSGTPGKAPYSLTVLLDGKDVTHLLDLKAIFTSLPATLRQEYTQLVSAASAAAVFDAITKRDIRIVHAPGPNGLPGAYPIRGSEKGVEVVLPEGLTLAEAIRLNQEGQRLDGIELIDENGTVYFTEQNMAILKRTLGYDCRCMPLTEVEDWAKELRAKYLECLNSDS